ncbi:arginase family protein [Thermococcus gammatolerans]|uniref:Arginase related protein n=1 Tax=Thermococcus gammatolerans (strain DSM 15229 / JCM 11827 / EJ3) TaxID=593117 RepID=C5A7G5_THEGJ|nr:arginase family protein [Thermococcus gammatolerans]ACS34177.1 Arginase related protein [Thermococcus gammatolerans EJ3]
MVTFVPFGEKPNREGVEYARKLLLREGLIEEANTRIVESRNVEGLAKVLQPDCCYVVGEHLATYGITMKLRPPSILSVDAHTDLMHDYLDHGSWLAYALENGIVNRAAVVGAVLMIPTTNRTRLWKRRVRIYPALPRTRRTGRGWKAYINLSNHGVGGVLDDALKYLGREVYLTIDLDVLRPEYRIARFQHGELTLEELLELIEGIKNRFKIISFDLAEISERIKRSKQGKKALVEVFSALRW